MVKKSQQEDLCFQSMAYFPGHTSESFSSGDREQILKRAKSLGISDLLDEKKDYQVDENLNPIQLRGRVETAMWTKGREIKKPIHVSKKDVLSAINFLELFSLYAQMSNLDHLREKR